MKLLNCSLLVAAGLSLVACSSAPIANSPDDADWRLRNFKESKLSSTLLIYNFCFKGKESDFSNNAKDFKPGAHTVVTRATRVFESIDSRPKESFATLEGNFSGGETYVFQSELEDDEGQVWIANADTGEVVTNKADVKLNALEVVDNEKRQQRRCQASTL